MSEIDLTSRIALKEYKDEGSLGKSQKQFLEAFRTSQPLTRDEAIYIVNSRYRESYRLSSACGRIKELEKGGFLEKLDLMVKSKATGRKVRVWRYIPENERNGQRSFL